MFVSEATVRLYVGGLPSDITSKQLEGRFASFGTVSNTKLTLSKQQSTSPGCRGFAYVDFCPKDDQSLHRCLSLYNGCKWLGGVLRVEKAKESYLARLRREWTAKPDVEEEDMAESDVAQDQFMQTEPLRIPTPASGFVKRKLMTVKPGPVKRIFAPYKGERLSNLSWDPPPTPLGVRKRRAAEAAAAAYIPPAPTQQSAGDTALPGLPALTNRRTQQALVAEPAPGASSSAAAAAAAAEEEEQQAHAQDQPDPSGVSSDEGVVDFMTDGESQEIANHSASNGHSQDIGLSRFDDSDDEQVPSPEPLDQSTSGALANAPDLSRFNDDDDDDDEQHQLPIGAVHQRLRSSAITAAPGFSRLDVGKQEQKQFEAPQPRATTTAAPDLTKHDDSSNDDQCDATEGQQLPQSSLPPSQAEPAQVSFTLSSPLKQPASSPASELAADSASDSAAEAASDLASGDNAQQLSFSSESGSPGEESSTSDGGNQPDFDSPHDPSDNAVHPHLAPNLQHELLQLPDESTDLLQHSAAEPKPDSDAEAELPSANSGLSNATSGSQQPSKVLMGAQTTEDMVEIGNPVGGSRSSSDASQRSSSPRQLLAGAALAGDAAVAAESPQRDDASGSAARHAEPEEAPLYPGLMSLRVGSAFWRQDNELSDKEWQAQRQVLHADYRAKHRAAVKHTQKARKPRRG
ncbi:TPA: hypothetical protein ACH3X2_005692 [Trebouxia sp. C0005]